MGNTFVIRKATIICLTALLLIISSFFKSSADTFDSGDCGARDDIITWMLTGTESEMVLTISGSGKMLDSGYVPWADWRDFIKEVVIEEGVTSIGKSMFSNCNNLERVTLPNSMEVIGEGAFRGCTSLTSIEIPGNVTCIGENVFYGCSGLTDLSIQEGLTELSKGAFSKCTSLTNVGLPDGLNSIGESAFSECGSLETISIPDSVTEIEKYAFYRCSALVNIDLPYGMKSINERVFSDCSALTGIAIPEGVIYIGRFSFTGSGLIEITIPDSVTNIDTDAFAGCRTLESIVLSRNLKSIRENLFYSDIALTSIVIPDGVTEIGRDAFFNCSSLESVQIPDSVTDIGEFAFYRCSALKSAELPESLKIINTSVFSGCHALTGIIIPDGVTEIGREAFRDCYSLNDITVPNSVTQIENFAFDGCSALTSVKLPDGLKCINRSVFNGCKALTSINIPDSVTDISELAFCECSSLTSVIIPDGVIKICASTFQRCHKLKTVTIPKTVISIEKSAFYMCEKITDVYYLGHQEMWESISIGESNSDLTGALIHYSPHEWSAEYTVDKEATCTEEGSESRHCLICDEIEEGTSRPIEKTSHKYGAWKITKEPTIDSEGSKERACSVCGSKETETIEKLSQDNQQGGDEQNDAEKMLAETKKIVGKAVSDAKTIQQGNYTEESYKALQDAIKEAEDLAADPNATADQLKAAEEKITAAKNALKLKAASTDTESPVDSTEQYGEDGTAVGKGASAEAAEQAILSLPDDNDPKGATFSPLKLKSAKQTKTSITLKWTKSSKAVKYVIYGNKCGKTKKFKKLATVKGKSSKIIKKVAGKKLKKGTYYKFMVVALDSNNKVVSTSKIVHVATKGKANYTKVTTKAKNNKVSLKKGKTFKLGAKTVGKNVKKHVGIRYESSNKKIATVSKAGKIKGKKKGSCFIYAYAQNGVFKKIKITVK